MGKPKLHELLAVMADTSNVSTAMLNEGKTVFAKKPEHFRGHTRTVAYFDESRSSENVTEEKAMVTTVNERLEYILHVLGRHYDALLQLEEANGRAKADLVVNGVTIMADVPATFLLGMEARLKNLRELLLTLPTLEPSIKWAKDDLAAPDVFTAPPAASFKTEKTVKSKVMYDATEHHPAQIHQWSEDVPVARVEVTTTSGMLPPAAKAVMLERCDDMIRAVKKARQRANATEVEDLHIANGIFSYIFGE